MNWTRYGKSGCGLICCIILAFVWRKWEERKASIWVAVSCYVWFIYSLVHLTNSMERVHSTFLSHSRNSLYLMYLSVHYFAQKSRPFVLIMMQINPILALPSYLTLILILSSHLHLSLAGGLFFASFPTKALYLYFSSSLYVLHVSPISSFSYDHPSSLSIWWAVQIMKLLSVHVSPAFCCLPPLRPDVFLSILFFLNALSLMFFP